MIDINTTATYTLTGDTQPTTTKPKISTRNNKTIIRGLVPLLTHHLSQITDEGARMHTTEVLHTASIVINDQNTMPDETGQTQLVQYRDHGRITTTYPGTRHLPVNIVLELAEELRDQLL